MTFVGERLDTISTNVSALGSSTRLGSIAGIDRGSATFAGITSDTVTVSAVVVALTQLAHLGATPAGTAENADVHLVRMTLTNTTTITATTRTGSNTVWSYELVEYNA